MLISTPEELERLREEWLALWRRSPTATPFQSPMWLLPWWRAFGSDPQWQKLRATPGLSDPEIVSNISNSILRPLPFSPIQ